MPSDGLCVVALLSVCVSLVAVVKSAEMANGPPSSSSSGSPMGCYQKISIPSQGGGGAGGSIDYLSAHSLVYVDIVNVDGSRGTDGDNDWLRKFTSEGEGAPGSYHVEDFRKDFARVMRAGMDFIAQPGDYHFPQRPLSSIKEGEGGHWNSSVVLNVVPVLATTTGCGISGSTGKEGQVGSRLRVVLYMAFSLDKPGSKKVSAYPIIDTVYLEQVFDKGLLGGSEVVLSESVRATHLGGNGYAESSRDVRKAIDSIVEEAVEYIPNIIPSPNSADLSPANNSQHDEDWCANGWTKGSLDVVLSSSFDVHDAESYINGRSVGGMTSLLYALLHESISMSTFPLFLGISGLSGKPNVTDAASIMSWTVKKAPYAICGSEAAQESIARGEEKYYCYTTRVEVCGFSLTSWGRLVRSVNLVGEVIDDERYDRRQRKRRDGSTGETTKAFSYATMYRSVNPNSKGIPFFRQCSKYKQLAPEDKAVLSRGYSRLEEDRSNARNVWSLRAVVDVIDSSGELNRKWKSPLLGERLLDEQRSGGNSLPVYGKGENGAFTMFEVEYNRGLVGSFRQARAMLTGIEKPLGAYLSSSENVIMRTVKSVPISSSESTKEEKNDREKVAYKEHDALLRESIEAMLTTCSVPKSSNVFKMRKAKDSYFPSVQLFDVLRDGFWNRLDYSGRDIVDKDVASQQFVRVFLVFYVTAHHHYQPSLLTHSPETLQENSDTGNTHSLLSSSTAVPFSSFRGLSESFRIGMQQGMSLLSLCPQFQINGNEFKELDEIFGLRKGKFPVNEQFEVVYRSYLLKEEARVSNLASMKSKSIKEMPLPVDMYEVTTQHAPFDLPEPVNNNDKDNGELSSALVIDLSNLSWEESAGVAETTNLIGIHLWKMWPFEIIDVGIKKAAFQIQRQCDDKRLISPARVSFRVKKYLTPPGEERDFFHRLKPSYVPATVVESVFNFGKKGPVSTLLPYPKGWCGTESKLQNFPSAVPYRASLMGPTSVTRQTSLPNTLTKSNFASFSLRVKLRGRTRETNNDQSKYVLWEEADSMDVLRALLQHQFEKSGLPFEKYLYGVVDEDVSFNGYGIWTQSHFIPKDQEDFKFDFVIIACFSVADYSTGRVTRVPDIRYENSIGISDLVIQDKINEFASEWTFEKSSLDISGIPSIPLPYSPRSISLSEAEKDSLMKVTMYVKGTKDPNRSDDEELGQALELSYTFLTHAVTEERTHSSVHVIQPMFRYQKSSEKYRTPALPSIAPVTQNGMTKVELVVSFMNMTSLTYLSPVDSIEKVKAYSSLSTSLWKGTVQDVYIELNVFPGAALLYPSASVDELSGAFNVEITVRPFRSWSLTSYQKKRYGDIFLRNELSFAEEQYKGDSGHAVNSSEISHLRARYYEDMFFESFLWNIKEYTDSNLQPYMRIEQGEGKLGLYNLIREYVFVGDAEVTPYNSSHCPKLFNESSVGGQMGSKDNPKDDYCLTFSVLMMVSLEIKPGLKFPIFTSAVDILRFLSFSGVRDSFFGKNHITATDYTEANGLLSISFDPRTCYGCSMREGVTPYRCHKVPIENEISYMEFVKGNIVRPVETSSERNSGAVPKREAYGIYTTEPTIDGHGKVSILVYLLDVEMFDMQTVDEGTLFWGEEKDSANEKFSSLLKSKVFSEFMAFVRIAVYERVYPAQVLVQSVEESRMSPQEIGIKADNVKGFLVTLTVKKFPGFVDTSKTQYTEMLSQAEVDSQIIPSMRLLAVYTGFDKEGWEIGHCSSKAYSKPFPVLSPPDVFRSLWMERHHLVVAIGNGNGVMNTSPFREEADLSLLQKESLVDADLFFLIGKPQRNMEGTDFSSRFLLQKFLLNIDEGYGDNRFTFGDFAKGIKQILGEDTAEYHVYLVEAAPYFIDTAWKRVTLDGADVPEVALFLEKSMNVSKHSEFSVYGFRLKFGIETVFTFKDNTKSVANLLRYRQPLVAVNRRLLRRWGEQTFPTDYLKVQKEDLAGAPYLKFFLSEEHQDAGLRMLRFRRGGKPPSSSPMRTVTTSESPTKNKIDPSVKPEEKFMEELKQNSNYVSRDFTFSIIERVQTGAVNTQALAPYVTKWEKYLELLILTSAAWENRNIFMKNVRVAYIKSSDADRQRASEIFTEYDKVKYGENKEKLLVDTVITEVVLTEVSLTQSQKSQANKELTIEEVCKLVDILGFQYNQLLQNLLMSTGLAWFSSHSSWSPFNDYSYANLEHIDILLLLSLRIHSHGKSSTRYAMSIPLDAGSVNDKLFQQFSLSEPEKLIFGSSLAVDVLRNDSFLYYHWDWGTEGGPNKEVNGLYESVANPRSQYMSATLLLNQSLYSEFFYLIKDLQMDMYRNMKPLMKGLIEDHSKLKAHVVGVQDISVARMRVKFYVTVQFRRMKVPREVKNSLLQSLCLAYGESKFSSAATGFSLLRFGRYFMLSLYKPIAESVAVTSGKGITAAEPGAILAETSLIVFVRPEWVNQFQIPTKYQEPLINHLMLFLKALIQYVPYEDIGPLESALFLLQEDIVSAKLNECDGPEDGAHTRKSIIPNMFFSSHIRVPESAPGSKRVYHQCSIIVTIKVERERWVHKGQELSEDEVKWTAERVISRRLHFLGEIYNYLVIHKNDLMLKVGSRRVFSLQEWVNSVNQAYDDGIVENVFQNTCDSAKDVVKEVSGLQFEERMLVPGSKDGQQPKAVDISFLASDDFVFLLCLALQSYDNQLSDSLDPYFTVGDAFPRGYEQTHVTLINGIDGEVKPLSSDMLASSSVLSSSVKYAIKAPDSFPNTRSSLEAARMFYVNLHKGWESDDAIEDYFWYISAFSYEKKISSTIRSGYAQLVKESPRENELRFIEEMLKGCNDDIKCFDIHILAIKPTISDSAFVEFNVEVLVQFSRRSNVPLSLTWICGGVAKDAKQYILAHDLALSQEKSLPLLPSNAVVSNFRVWSKYDYVSHFTSGEVTSDGNYLKLRNYMIAPVPVNEDAKVLTDIENTLLQISSSALMYDYQENVAIQKTTTFTEVNVHVSCEKAGEALQFLVPFEKRGSFTFVQCDVLLPISYLDIDSVSKRLDAWFYLEFAFTKIVSKSRSTNVHLGRDGEESLPFDTYCNLNGVKSAMYLLGAGDNDRAILIYKLYQALKAVKPLQSTSSYQHFMTLRKGILRPLEIQFHPKTITEALSILRIRVTVPASLCVYQATGKFILNPQEGLDVEPFLGYDAWRNAFVTTVRGILKLDIDLDVVVRYIDILSHRSPVLEQGGDGNNAQEGSYFDVYASVFIKSGGFASPLVNLCPLHGQQFYCESKDLVQEDPALNRLHSSSRVWKNDSEATKGAEGLEDIELEKQKVIEFDKLFDSLASKNTKFQNLITVSPVFDAWDLKSLEENVETPTDKMVVLKKGLLSVTAFFAEDGYVRNDDVDRKVLKPLSILIDLCLKDIQMLEHCNVHSKMQAYDSGLFTRFMFDDEKVRSRGINSSALASMEVEIEYTISCPENHDINLHENFLVERVNYFGREVNKYISIEPQKSQLGNWATVNISVNRTSLERESLCDELNDHASQRFRYSLRQFIRLHHSSGLSLYFGIAFTGGMNRNNAVVLKDPSVFDISESGSLSSLYIEILGRVSALDRNPKHYDGLGIYHESDFGKVILKIFIKNSPDVWKYTPNIFRWDYAHELVKKTYLSSCGCKDILLDTMYKSLETSDSDVTIDMEVVPVDVELAGSYLFFLDEEASELWSSDVASSGEENYPFVLRVDYLLRYVRTVLFNSGEKYTYEFSTIAGVQDTLSKCRLLDTQNIYHRYSLFYPPLVANHLSTQAMSTFMYFFESTTKSFMNRLRSKRYRNLRYPQKGYNVNMRTLTTVLTVFYPCNIDVCFPDHLLHRIVQNTHNDREAIQRFVEVSFKDLDIWPVEVDFEDIRLAHRPIHLYVPYMDKGIEYEGIDIAVSVTAYGTKLVGDGNQKGLSALQRLKENGSGKSADMSADNNVISRKEDEDSHDSEKPLDRRASESEYFDLLRSSLDTDISTKLGHCDKSNDDELPSSPLIVKLQSDEVMLALDAEAHEHWNKSSFGSSMRNVWRIETTMLGRVRKDTTLKFFYGSSSEAFDKTLSVPVRSWERKVGSIDTSKYRQSNWWSGFNRFAVTIYGRMYNNDIAEYAILFLMSDIGLFRSDEHPYLAQDFVMHMSKYMRSVVDELGKVKSLRTNTALQRFLDDTHLQLTDIHPGELLVTNQQELWDYLIMENFRNKRPSYMTLKVDFYIGLNEDGNDVYLDDKSLSCMFWVTLMLNHEYGLFNHAPVFPKANDEKKRRETRALDTFLFVNNLEQSPFQSLNVHEESFARTGLYVKQLNKLVKSKLSTAYSLTKALLDIPDVRRLLKEPNLLPDRLCESVALSFVNEQNPSSFDPSQVIRLFAYHTYMMLLYNEADKDYIEVSVQEAELGTSSYELRIVFRSSEQCLGRDKLRTISEYLIFMNPVLSPFRFG
eukprot:Nk52_evm6s1271 gene=Nk52_evmTU6s1271